MWTNVTEETAMNDIKEALNLYVVHHIQPGGFLTAVLENDLREAVGRADGRNILILKEIVQYVHCELPGSCWGSVDKVTQWLKGDEK